MDVSSIVERGGFAYVNFRRYESNNRDYHSETEQVSRFTAETNRLNGPEGLLIERTGKSGGRKSI